jgi:nicotinate-nucleotide adenylyltransferase
MADLHLGFLPPRRIGLLGGSFNPAHEGHRHVSREALKRLGLDQVWWLVAPQNPLKPEAGMAAFARRLDLARAAARDPRIRVLDIEARLGTRYTVDTVRALMARFPRVRFVWLMGADNLRQVRHWRRWRQIFARIPVAVLDRPGYAARALSELPARALRRHRLPAAAAPRLAETAPPAWIFLPIRLDPRSATAIRAGH